MTHSLPQEGAAVQVTTTEKAFPSGRRMSELPEKSPSGPQTMPFRYRLAAFFPCPS